MEGCQPTHHHHRSQNHGSCFVPLVSFFQLLTETQALGTRAGLLRGLGVGLTNAASLAGYAGALAYGGARVRARAYEGGDVVSVIFAAMSAGFALAQVVPAAAAVGLGSAAAGRMLDIVDG